MLTISLELIFNLSLLVALSVVSGFIEKRWNHQTRNGIVLQGALFGCAAILGMLNPLDLGQGIIVDGRSVMVSLGSLFFGPIAGAVAAGMTMLYRIGLGGTGTLTGVLVILSSFSVGVLGYRYLKPVEKVPSVGKLYLFGLVVHFLMLALMFTLPAGTGTGVVLRIGLPVLLFYPLATILVGKILADQIQAFHVLGDLQRSNQNLSITLNSIGDAVISTDLNGRIVFMNPVAETLTGWSQPEARGKPQAEIFRIINETTREPAENPVHQALHEGLVVGLANHTLLIAKDGTERPIADSAAPIRTASGNISGVVLVFRDLSEERNVQRLIQARLTLLENARCFEPESFFARALEQISRVLDSPMVLYRLLEIDLGLSPLQSSALALEGACFSSAWENHASLARSRSWAECLSQKKPVIRNGTGLPDATEPPEGSLDPRRLLLVPVKRDDKVVAVMGLGNKAKDYTETDVETAAFLAEELWRILEKEQAEQSVQESEGLFRSLFEHHAAVKLLLDPETGVIVDANQAAMKYYGWTTEQLRQMRIQEINTLSPDEIRREMDKARALEKVSFEFRHKRADGSIREVEVHSSRIEVKGRVLLHSIVHDISDRIQAERSLSSSEARFRLLVESAPDAIFVQTRGRFAYLNDTAVRLFGAAAAVDLIGTSVLERFHPDYREIVQERIRLLAQAKENVPLLHEVCLRMDGTGVDVEVSAVPMTYDGEDGALVFMRDISERLEAEKSRRQLETQLQQAQKIESVGRLAGGVAHDYNNMLSVIIGYAEMGLLKLDSAAPLAENFKQILAAALRSRDITRQLLAFARKQTLSPRVLDLNETLEGMLKMLRRLIGESIDLAWLPGKNQWPVEIDPSQLDQLLANLVINASDAIADVGKITIETSVASFDQAYCNDHPGFIPGDYVMLAVSDDGCGMDKETMNHLFEPFFTTKKPGEGTGLGLATVYGTIKQSNGFINVYSEPGKGTTFKLYLPRYLGPMPVERPAGQETLTKGQGELILLVEDEPLILTMTESILQDLGYRVLTARTPADAFGLAVEHGENIQLLITDVVMPEMNGRALAERLQAIYPRLHCLYMSGYTANAIVHRGVLDEGLNFIQKPFSRIDLGQKVRKILRSEA